MNKGDDKKMDKVGKELKDKIIKEVYEDNDEYDGWDGKDPLDAIIRLS